MPADFFTNLVNRIFPEKESEDDKLPLVTEPLERSIKYKHAYEAWYGSDRFAGMMAALAEQKTSAHTLGLQNQAFQLYESPQSNGFYFNTAMNFSTDEFRFVLDHFCEVTKELGYRPQIAERRYSERPNGVHCMERYYLKPELPATFEPPLDQRYGNVHLELVLLNEQPSYLKVMAHVYQDRNYLEALPFAPFAERLFDTQQER